MNHITKLNNREMSYEEPQVNCIDLEPEKVLCQSQGGKFSIDSLEYEETDKFLNF